MAEETLYKACLSKASALCSRREYCSQDIRLKLETWGLGENDITRILTYLTRENFINESRYAEAFVRDKFNYNKWGRIKIAMHLKQKKIPSESIKNALETIDYDTYLKTAADLLASHRRHIKAKNTYELKAKLIRFGLSRGFEQGLLYEIIGASAEF